MPAVDVIRTICRACHAQCPLVVHRENGLPIKVYGDKDDPVYFGYSCIKGRAFPVLHRAPQRLLGSCARGPDGHVPIASGDAVAAIAERVQQIVATHGPRAVAIYIGTHGFNDLRTAQVSQAWMAALGSPMVFTSVTIDQPGKAVSTALHGPWLAGAATFDDADVWMLLGTNPIVSMNGLPVNPARAIKRARQRGLRLIVADPRRSECARAADLHLQVRPGEDATLLAGMAHIIVREGLGDAAFVANEAQGIEQLAAAVEPFTPAMVAERCGVKAEAIVAAARLYASGRRGGVMAGTGSNMAGHGNLTEYLCKTVMTLCGHWLRAGDRIANPGVLIHRPPPIAASPGPLPAWGFGTALRVKGLTETIAGLPTAALPDEILTAGEGRVRALFVLGGNPMLAWPDQLKTYDALRALDLLVCIDPVMTATGRLAHYVVAPKLPFESPQPSALQEMVAVIGQGWGYPAPYAHWADALLEPPAEADVIEDWEFFYRMAQHQGLVLKLPPISFPSPEEAAAHATVMDMSRIPDPEEIWDLVLKDSPVPLAQVKARARGGGVLFDLPPLHAQPKPAGWTGRLDLANAAMMAELAAVADAGARDQDADFPFRLVSRRLHDMHNSSWHFSPAQQRRWAYNPAFMHPDDARSLGVDTGDLVEIRSQRAAIRGVVEVSDEMRPGVISMSHGFGGLPDEPEDPRAVGGSTGRLSSVDSECDPHTGIPRMSAIPVRLWRVVGEVSAIAPAARPASTPPASRRST